MKPPALNPGDTIGVMAPSSVVERNDIERSKALLESKSYKVFVHPQTYEQEHSSAGSHLQKALALQGLWQREDIKAIWAAGGGNRALHLLESINFEKMAAKPKIFIGFSDVTALLNGVYAHTGLTTFHGPVFKNLHKHGEMDHLLGLLQGDTSSYDLSSATLIKEGHAQGPLIGGNLSLFHYLPHTLPGEFWEGALLFLEECNEELSRIDRMILQLKRLGVLGQINGLILGEFTDPKDTGRPFGYSLEDIIREHTDGLDIPTLINAPFGHGEVLFTFPIGVQATLDSKNMSLELSSSAVTS